MYAVLALTGFGGGCIPGGYFGLRRRFRFFGAAATAAAPRSGFPPPAFEPWVFASFGFASGLPSRPDTFANNRVGLIIWLIWLTFMSLFTGGAPPPPPPGRGGGCLRPSAL